MNICLASVIAGFVGDTCTFAGGCLLAWDALAPEKAFQDDQKFIAVVSHPALEKLPIEFDKQVVKSPDEMRVVLMHRRAKKAKIGFVLLVFGFAALLATRILEHVK